MISLDELEALAAKATQGPWEWRPVPYDKGCYDGLYTPASRCSIANATTCEHVQFHNEADAALMSAANPSTVKVLIEIARAARGCFIPGTEDERRDAMAVLRAALEKVKP